METAMILLQISAISSDNLPPKGTFLCEISEL